MRFENSRGSPKLAVGLGLALLLTGCGGGSSPPPGSAPPSITVTVSPSTASVPVGGTQQFTAVVSGTSNTAVTWSVNGITGGNAVLGTVSTSGLYTAPGSVPASNPLTVSATSQGDSSRSGSASVTITQPPFALSSLSPIVAMQSAAAFTLTVNGSGFTPTSQVSYNHATKTTTFMSTTQLTAQISATDVSLPGAFPVVVQSGSTATAPLNFYVVPSINPRTVSVSGGATAGGVNIAVPKFDSPSLAILAVGIGSSAGVTAVAIPPGSTTTLFVVGKGIQAGTFFMVSGNPNDISLTQPLAADFAVASGGIPAVQVTISVSASAALGPRNLLVTNSAGEISVFVGGLLIGSGT